MSYDNQIQFGISISIFNGSTADRHILRNYEPGTDGKTKVEALPREEPGDAVDHFSMVCFEHRHGEYDKISLS